MERYVDVVSLVYGESHTRRSICSHEAVSTEDREADMHDEMLILVCEWSHTLLSGNITESGDTSFEFSSEYAFIEVESYFSLVREVQVGSSRGHREKIMK